MTTLATPPVTAAPPAGGPRPRRWTVAEFHALGDSGLFEGRRAKLIAGEIIEEGPMNPPHALTMELVDLALRAAFGAGWRFRNQLPLPVGRDTDPLPDFAVIAGDVRGASGHPATAALVVEVSDTSLGYDTGEKRLIYAAAGVPEYWVLDINGRQLFVYRAPQGGDYASQQALGPADEVAPLSAPAAVRVADLLA